MKGIRRRLFHTYANLDLPIRWQDGQIETWASGKGITTRRDCMAVTGIAAKTFAGNKELKTFPEFRWFTGLTSIGNDAFNGCTSLASIILPDGLTSIGFAAFGGCTSLALTSLPEGLTSIGSYAFSGCPNMRVTVIPETVTSIGVGAFNGWKNNTKMTIPASLTSIGDWRLNTQPNLQYVRMKASTPPTLGNKAYVGNNTKIYVPDESVKAYKAADVWSDIAGRIYPVSEWPEE